MVKTRGEARGEAREIQQINYLINMYTNVFIVSDHGGAGTGHGDADNPHIIQTVFYAQHPNLNFSDYHTTSMADLAPTILDFLGVRSEKYECKKDGVSLIE